MRIKRKIIMTILVVLITATMAFSRVSHERQYDAREFFDSPGYLSLVACYQMRPGTIDGSY